MVRKVFKPKIDTLPLSIAAREANTDEEKALCFDLAFAIVEGSDWPRKLMESGEANKRLTPNSIKALTEVLDSSNAYELEKKRKRVTISDDDSVGVQEICEKNATQVIVKEKGKPSSYGVAGVEMGKGKGKAILKSGKRQIVCGLLDSTIEAHTYNIKGTRWCETKLGYMPKYKLYLEANYAEGGWKKFDVYEDYDSGISSGPDIPMSPNTSEEWDPNKHAFLVLKKHPKKSAKDEVEENSPTS